MTLSTKKISIFLEKWIRPFCRSIIFFIVQIVTTVQAYLIFTQVDQSIEVYRAIALDQNFLGAIGTTFYVSTLAFFIWYSARSLQQKYGSRLKSQDKLNKWIPRLLGVGPIISLAGGIWKTSPNVKTNPGFFLSTWLIANILIGGIFFYLFIKRGNFSDRQPQQTDGKITKSLTSINDTLFNPRLETWFVNISWVIFSAFALPIIQAETNSILSLGTIIVLILPIALNIILYLWHNEQQQELLILSIGQTLLAGIFIYLLSPVFVPDLVGPISVVAIGLTIGVVVFSTMYSWGIKNKIPVMTSLVILLAISSYTNTNDNHQFRQFAKIPPTPIPTLETSFKHWLASRPDLDKFTNKPYPVYLATAQGGGIFAAYHAATTFSKLTEYFPNFPQHVFAISSVSGGSLGASGFNSLVKASEIIDRTSIDGSNKIRQLLSSKSSELFGSDLLSPLLSLTLFPDLIQRFFPLPINDWDRANGLEVALEHAWDTLQIKGFANPFKKSFYQHWKAEGIAPALLLNTTVVETGERLVISPFQILAANQENITLDENNLDLRLSTAAGLSARFPYVTPAGWYKRSTDGQKVRLVDGGYFDNSGIPTALDIGRSLQHLEKGRSFEIIYLSLVDRPTTSSAHRTEREGLDEVMSPIRAIFSAREARSRSAVDFSTYTLNDGITDPFKFKFRTMMLKKTEGEVKLPLGWLLSKSSQQLIDRQTPSPSLCNVDRFNRTDSNSSATGINVYNHNSCVAKSIGDDLNSL